jgi:hypothetical protein
MSRRFNQPQTAHTLKCKRHKNRENQLYWVADKEETACTVSRSAARHDVQQRSTRHRHTVHNFEWNQYSPGVDGEGADGACVELVGADDLVRLAADAQQQALVGGHVDGGAARVTGSGACRVTVYNEGRR